MRAFALMMVVVAVTGVGCSSDDQENAEPAITTDSPPSDNPGSSDTVDSGIAVESYPLDISGSSIDDAHASRVPPKPIHRVQPEYPEEARQEKISGTVHLEVSVNAEGEVIGAKTIRPSGDSRLDKAAEEAALKWSFEKAEDPESDKLFRIVIPFKFELD